MKTLAIPGIGLLMIVAATVGAGDVVSPCNGTTTLQQGKTDPLIGAAGSGDLAEVKRLVGLGHDVNYQECDDVSQRGGVSADRGWTALMAAAMHGHLDIIKFLVDAGARLDTRTTGRETALTLAERAERLDAVELLRKLGASDGRQDPTVEVGRLTEN